MNSDASALLPSLFLRRQRPPTKSKPSTLFSAVKKRGRLELCFGSRPDVANEYCPQGFGDVVVNILERTETYKLNRHGKLVGMGGVYRIGGDVVFNPDGSINVLVVEVPNGMTVSLPNAHVPVTTTTASMPEKKATDSNATLKIIFCGVLLILILVIISAFLLYCCWYKKRNQQPAQVHQTHDKTREADKSPPQTAAKSIVHSLPKRLTSAPGTAPNRTSTSTTRASDEKPRVVVAPKPSSTTPVVSPFNPVSLTSTQMSTPGVTTMPNSNASKKPRRRALPASGHVERSVECSSIFQDYCNNSASNSHAELSHHGK
uniref:LAM_G_DOMAIN domain-containing protein n=1 Tax=Panagrellus redivivus TaxID=6233 RepID=A0A7E4VMP4_PANRE